MIDRFRLFLAQRGWTVTRERPAQSGTQLTVSDGAVSVHCTFYNSGTVLVQGPKGDLKDALLAWAGKAAPSGGAGWGAFPLGWREWDENADWLAQYIAKNGVPDEATAPEQYLIQREVCFHDYMFRQESHAIITREKLGWAITNWFHRHCFMNLDVTGIVADVMSYANSYEAPTDPVGLEVAADAISFVMCNHCATRFTSKGVCPQVNEDQNSCAADLIDALYPYSSAGRVVAYTAGNLKRLLKGGKDVNWYDLAPQSPIEEALGKALTDAGILYVPQYQAHGNEHRYKIDYVIKTVSGPHIAVECDGLEFHARPQNYVRDRARDRYLQAHGFYVMRFSSVEIFNKIDSCIKEVDEAFWRIRKGKLSLDSPPRNSYFGVGE